MNVNIVRTELDLDRPVEAGSALASDTFCPVLNRVEQLLSTPEERIQFWAGVLSSLAGSMAAAIGAEATEVIFDSIKPMARTVEAEFARRGH